MADAKEPPLITAIRAAVLAGAPVVDGHAVVNLNEAIDALATCLAYLLAGAPADRRALLTLAAVHHVTGNIDRIVAQGHEIVGTAFEVPAVKH